MALRKRVAVGEHAVDAVAHDDAVLVWLDVYVGRALAQRFHEYAVDEADDGRVYAVAHYLLARELGEVVDLFYRVERLLPDAAFYVVERAYEALHLGWRQQRRVHARAGGGGEQLRVGRRRVVRYGDGHHAALKRERDDAAVAQDVEAHALGDEREDFFGIYVEVPYRARGHFISPRERTVPLRRRAAARR